MNKLFYCNNSGQYHYVYAKNHLLAAHKFKERFKRLFGKWYNGFMDVREVKKPFIDPKIVEERKAEAAKQITNYDKDHIKL